MYMVQVQSIFINYIAKNRINENSRVIFIQRIIREKFFIERNVCGNNPSQVTNVQKVFSIAIKIFFKNFDRKKILQYKYCHKMSCVYYQLHTI